MDSRVSNNEFEVPKKWPITGPHFTRTVLRYKQLKPL